MSSSLPYYDQKIIDLRARAVEPHYKFVQFLTALCAGMLGLSAPQQELISSNSVSSWLALIALSGLALCIVLGVVALYGEKNAYDSRADLMEKILRENGNNHILSEKDDRIQGSIRPPAIHRGAFYGLCLISILSLFALLGSKAALLCG